MSHDTYVSRSLNSLSKSPKFKPISRIIVVVSDDIQYEAGNTKGETLIVNTPWGNQAVADNLLKTYTGFEYQPYEADGAFVDPAAEIGDGVTVAGIYSGLYYQEMIFGPTLKSSFSAPQSQQINHEYPYKSKRDRKVTRQFKGVETSLKVQAGLIESEVKSREQLASIVTEQETKISQNADSISAEVTARETLGKTVNANTSAIVQNAASISAEVSARETLGETVNANTSAIVQNASSISAKVSKTGGSASSFGWNMTDVDMVFSAKDAQILRMSEDGGEWNGKLSLNGGKWINCPPNGIYMGPEGFMVSDKAWINSDGTGHLGGWDVGEWELSTGGGTWDHCEAGSTYAGWYGLNFSDKFKLNQWGHLIAESGTFKGTVQAGMIVSGEGNTFDGGGITPGSVSGGEGGQLAQQTVNTGNVTFGGTLSQVHTNTDNLTDLGAEIVGINSKLNGNTQATAIDVSGNLKGNNLYAVTSFNCLGHRAKWGKIGGVNVLTY